MSERRRELLFEPGYDRRSEGRGCHGLDMRWLIHGEHATVQFVIYTSWLPSWVAAGPWGPNVHGAPDQIFPPIAADLGYHADQPLYEDQLGQAECAFRGGHRCFYDGSGLNAEPVFAALLTEGGDVVWRHLEEYLTQVEQQLTEVGP